MSAKYAIILNYEQRFIVSVVFQMRANIPQPLWHLFIPFRFLFEFVAARRDIKRISTIYLFVRNLALDAVHQAGDDQIDSRLEMERRIREWLSKHQLYSRNLSEKYLALAELLMSHYTRLLKAEGRSYESLVRNAYGNRADYESFQQQLIAMENNIEQIPAKQLEIHAARTKETQQIFAE
jgi:hypothetical protein